MTRNEWRLERIQAALVQRQAEVRRLLSLKDPEKEYRLTEGYAFHIVGGERVRLEMELRFVEETLALLAEEGDVQEGPHGR